MRRSAHIAVGTPGASVSDETHRASTGAVLPDGARVFDFTRGRNLLVASTGGHLAELWRLQPEQARGHRSWITFDTPQSRDLLEGEEVVFVPYIAPRDVRGVLRGARIISRVVRRTRPDAIVSTGAAVALSAGLVASTARLPMVYIESVARLQGPSMTGAILARSRRVSTWTQVEDWATSRWPVTQSVLARYERLPDVEGPACDRPRLFVTLGTIAPYRFDALVDGVLATGLADENTTWQLGSSLRSDLPGRVHAGLGYREMQRAIADADLVVTHAGVGTVLDVLDGGKLPVVVPRRSSRGEHVDDHQTDLARHLSEAGLSATLDASQLSRGAILAAARARVGRLS